MAADWAGTFYQSKRWIRCRQSYAKYRRGLCERCLAKGIYKPGTIVHHKQHLTPETIGDPAVALSFDNLELLCHACHDAEHGVAGLLADANAERNRKKHSTRRFTVDEDGRVSPLLDQDF